MLICLCLTIQAEGIVKAETLMQQHSDVFEKQQKAEGVRGQ